MLPNLNLPEFITKLPSDEREVNFRPFLVKEEKILLMAMEGGDSKEVENAVIKILCNCINLTEKEVNELPPFDIEYLFLQIRSKSVDNVVKLRLSHKDKEKCDHATEYQLNIDDIEVFTDPKHNKKIMLTDTAGVVMRYPSMKSTEGLQDAVNESAVDSMFETIAKGIEMVFDNDTVYEDSTIPEKIQFLENLNKDQFEKILDFYRTMPVLTHSITYICEKCGQEETITLRGLSSFFS